MLSTEENKVALRRAIESFNNLGNRSAYLDLYDANCVLHGFPPGLAPGVAGLNQFYRGVWTAFPDSHLDIDDVVAEGESVACRFTLRATHQGDFMGIPATGKPVVLTGMTILRFANGKCVERWNNTDMLGLLQQLGSIPVSA